MKIQGAQFLLALSLMALPQVFSSASAREPDSSELAAQLTIQANAIQGTGRYEEALRLYLKALEKRDTLLNRQPQSADASLEKALVLLNIAEVEWILCRCDAANENYTEAIEICTESLQISPNDNKSLKYQARALIGQARVEWTIGHRDSALAQTNQAIKIFDSLLNAALADDQLRFEKADALSVRADLETVNYSFPEADGDYHEALKLLDNIKDAASMITVQVKKNSDPGRSCLTAGAAG
ncbi:MAG: tetratricopeptide repeat protein [Cyanobacteria bacterium REEB67]|nr:tetratricopeptide repeat protein [Cyanobacteria bacterium REEB67]